MEFWGVEVKSGEPLVVETGDDFILHISQACLGEMKKDKGNESVCLSVKIDDRKFVLGTLSHKKIPQLAFDLVFEQDFELSHNWKHGSVYFSGYKIPQTETGHSEPEFDIEEDLPVATNNGKPGSETKNSNSGVEKLKSESKQKVNTVEPTKAEKPNKDTDDSSDDEDDSSNDSSDNDESGDDQHMVATGEDEIDETDDDDESDEDSDQNSDEDEAPKMMKAEQGKKRSAESAKKTSLPVKKAKLVTPPKTDGNKAGGHVHVATPHPSKQAVKTPAISNQKKDQTPKPFTCAACNRSFGSENALQSHSKAKHSAA